MLNSQITLTLFFLYVVIISDKFFDIISCRLQRLIMFSSPVRHFFIFMNIFLFTFILGWYTEFSIFDAKESFNKRNKEDFQANENGDNKLIFNKISIRKEANILIKYLGYSILIYVLFILTTKCELEYLITFLMFILASFIIFILNTYAKKETEIKTRLSIFEFISRSTKDREIDEYLKKNNDKPFKEKQKEVSRIYTRYILTNLENILFVLSLIMLVSGVIIYFFRKRGEYGNEFQYIKFVFGTLKCKNNL